MRILSCCSGFYLLTWKRPYYVTNAKRTKFKSIMIAVTAVYRAGMIWQIQRYHRGLIIAVIVDMTSNLIYLNCIWLSGISYCSQCDLSVGGTLMYSCACSIKTIPFMLAKFLLTKFTVDATVFLSWRKKLMYSSPISQRSLFLYLFRTSRLKYIHLISLYSLVAWSNCSR